MEPLCKALGVNVSFHFRRIRRLAINVIKAIQSDASYHLDKYPKPSLYLCVSFHFGEKRQPLVGGSTCVVCYDSHPRVHDSLNAWFVIITSNKIKNKKYHHTPSFKTKTSEVIWSCVCTLVFNQTFRRRLNSTKCQPDRAWWNQTGFEKCCLGLEFKGSTPITV